MVSIRLRLCLPLAALAPLLAPAAAWTAPDCADLMPSGAPFPMRDLVPGDLVRLRDIGPVDANQQYGGLFSVSPDGTLTVAIEGRSVEVDPFASARILVSA